MGDKFVKLAVYIGAASILIVLNASVLKEMFNGLSMMFHAAKSAVSTVSRSGSRSGGVNTSGGGNVSGNFGKSGSGRKGGGLAKGASIAGGTSAAVAAGSPNQGSASPAVISGGKSASELGPGFSRKKGSEPGSVSGDRPTWKKQGSSLPAPMANAKAPGEETALSGMIKSANKKVKNNPSLGMIDPKAAAAPSNDRQKYEMQKSAARDAGRAAYNSAKSAGKSEKDARQAQKDAIRSTKKDAEKLTADYGQIYGRLSDHERDAVDTRYKSNVDHMNQIQSNYDSGGIYSKNTDDYGGFERAKQLYLSTMDRFGLADGKEVDEIVRKSLTDTRLAGEVYRRVQNNSRNVLTDYQLSAAFVMNGYQTLGENRMSAMYNCGRINMPRGAINAFEKGTALYSDNADLRYIGMVQSVRSDNRYSKADGETIVKAVVARINSERLSKNL